MAEPIREKWEGSMTPRERFNRQMHWQSVDRSFHMEFGYWDENYKIWSMFKDNGITNEWEANQFFNFDPIAVVGGNVNIVATTFEWADQIDPERAAASEERARAVLSDKSASDKAHRMAEARLKRALIRQNIANR